jgi:hypothetical protein
MQVLTFYSTSKSGEGKPGRAGSHSPTPKNPPHRPPTCKS